MKGELGNWIYFFLLIGFYVMWIYINTIMIGNWIMGFVYGNLFIIGQLYYTRKIEPKIAENKKRYANYIVVVIFGIIGSLLSYLFGGLV